MVLVLRGVFLEAGNVSAIRKENVRTSVSVVVKDSDSAGHRFRNVASFCLTILQLKGNGLELEVNRRRRLRKGSSEFSKSEDQGEGENERGPHQEKKGWLSPPLVF